MKILLKFLNLLIALSIHYPVWGFEDDFRSNLLRWDLDNDRGIIIHQKSNTSSSLNSSSLNNELEYKENDEYKTFILLEQLRMHEELAQYFEEFLKKLIKKEGLCTPEGKTLKFEDFLMLDTSEDIMQQQPESTSSATAD